MSMDMLMDILLDGLLDSLRLVPFLFLTYLTMEYLEHKTSTKTRAVVRRAGKLGPLAGSIAGVFPQCGFSAAASNLYAGGVITTGTLIAVFLSTSDEMLPIFISESVSVRVIAVVLGIKLVLGMITGFLVDFIFRFRPSPIRYKEIHSMCESEHCGCEEGIFPSALKHTVKIFLFVFLFSIALGFLIQLGGGPAGTVSVRLSGSGTSSCWYRGTDSELRIINCDHTAVFRTYDQLWYDDVRTIGGGRRGTAYFIPDK